MTVLTNLPMALASLAVCLGTGIWIGYRYALQSKALQAAIDHALAKVDTDWEDEVPARRSGPAVCACLADDPWSRAAARHAAKDWNWDAETWWGKENPK